MAKHYLESTTIKYVDYDRGSHTLKVAFPGSEAKVFLHVPSDIYEALFNAQSPGTYYHDHIDGRFEEKEF